MKIIRLFVVLMSLLTVAPSYAASGQDDELALLTYLKLKPGTEEKFMQAFNKIVKPSLAEPGNVAWYVQEAQDDPTTIVFYTRWKNEDALKTHLSSKPLVDYIAETAPLLAAPPQLVRFHPIDQLRNSPSGDPSGCDNCECCP